MKILKALKIDNDIKWHITYIDSKKTEEFIYRNNKLIRVINYKNGIEDFCYEYEYYNNKLIFTCRRYKGVLDGCMTIYNNTDKIVIQYKNGEIV